MLVFHSRIDPCDQIFYVKSIKTVYYSSQWFVSLSSFTNFTIEIMTKNSSGRKVGDEIHSY